MGKSLVIAEKPSVARDICRALGVKAPQRAEFFEDDDYVISSAVGHLLEIKAPDSVEVKRGKWSFNNLPVIPPAFDLNPIAKTQDRLKLLAKLIKRKDIDSIINACDAGREGELIFRLIAQHTKAKQPVQRLWLQSMTQNAIRDAFANLRDDKDMLPLADAARCRSEADWLIGINGTRAMTAFNSQDGGFYLTTVGRVQTPTLTLVVEREEKIRQFVPRQYFEVHGDFSVDAGQYAGRWFDPDFKKDELDPEKRAERIWDKDKAFAIVADCEGKEGIVTEETKPSSQSAPMLFDLTSLQREANGRFGFSARATLSLAQALYERHKVLTYPRTDSRALPEDYLPTVKKTMAMLRDEASPRLGELDPAFLANPLAPHADAVVKNDWVKPNKRIFNDAKISDHFAIIPTLQAPKNLSEPELKLYDLVVRRFLSIFHPPARFQNTTRITTVEKHQFRTEGKVLIEPGWLAIYGRKANAGGDDTLVAVKPDEKAQTEAIEARDLATRPPARFTEATILSAMEGAGKTFEDDELREAMNGKGLGTPATRAAIIEGLIREVYLVREDRALIPTTKAFQLLTLLRGLGVNELTKPELTGEWESKLSLIEQGDLDRNKFMDEINAMTEQIVARAKNYGSTSIPGDYATLKTPCPTCGSVVKENYKRFACTSDTCEFSISKIPGSRPLEIDEAEELLTNRVIGPLNGFRSRQGRPFSAMIKITDEHKLEFDFGQDDDENAEPIDVSGKERLGDCPKCGNGVYENGMSYVCEKATGPEKSCDFKSGKVILQQEISEEQMKKLLTVGKTDLLTEFISNRTRRKFKAFLSRNEEGKVSFEFEPRPAKKGGAKGAKGAKGSKAGKDDAVEGKDEEKAAKKPAKKAAAKKKAAKKPAKKKAAKKAATKASKKKAD